MIPRALGRPMPEPRPSSFVVTNGSVTRSNTSSAMPVPSSEMEIIT